MIVALLFIVGMRRGWRTMDGEGITAVPDHTATSWPDDGRSEWIG